MLLVWISSLEAVGRLLRAGFWMWFWIWFHVWLEWLLTLVDDGEGVPGTEGAPLSALGRGPGLLSPLVAFPSADLVWKKAQEMRSLFKNTSCSLEKGHWHKSITIHSFSQPKSLAVFLPR